MSEEFLKELEIDAETAKKIVSQSKEDIKDRYVPIECFNEVNEELKNNKGISAGVSVKISDAVTYKTNKKRIPA